jgi:WD40 repeat protein
LTQIQDLRFSPDGKTLAIAGGTPGEEGAIELWNWPGRELQETHAVHSDMIYQLAWSADSKRIFTASHDAGVSEIHAESGKILRSYSGHSQPVRGLCLLEDQETLVSAGNDQTIRVWNTKSGQLARSLNNHTNAILGLAERPRANDNPQLPMIASIGADATVRIWQPTIGRMVRFLRLPASTPLALAWSSDGESLLITLKNGQLLSLNPDTLEIQSTTEIELREPLSLLIQPKGKHAAIGGQDGKIKAVPLD